MATSQEVTGYWFGHLGPGDWFRKDPALDADITERFAAVLAAALRGELYVWRTSAEGRLAEIIVLDQFSRNIHRDTPGAFAADPLALILAQEAIDRGVDRALDVSRRAFLYMPFMHSESLSIHDRAVELFAQPGLESQLGFEQRHRGIIERFGRYPHRNAILGRESTPEELAFLEQPGSSF
ncbi:DUF924 family protein [Halomonas halmophila]|uniref:Membrane protein n=1 Tax=Halomonas halmophila TaxID=252 RepID=A0A4Y4EX88_9GAMM|nr:DUF924 family protein [Halomonas halmophila]GED21713.1 membrane protein [Halomonas halmophila]